MGEVAVPLRSGVRSVITAAGDSRGLFLPAGFGRPKGLVTWDGRKVIEQAVASYAINLQLCTVAINSDEDAEWKIGETIRDTFPEVRIVPVSSAVKGALATAMIGLGEPDDAPVVIASGDSRIAGGIAPYVSQFIEQGMDAGTIVFESTDPRWSYLSVNDRGVVQQVAEKRVIGPYATTGVFFFAKSRDFADASSWAFVNNATHLGRYYVSTALNYLISVGKRVGFTVIDRAEFGIRSLPVDFALERK